MQSVLGVILLVFGCAALIATVILAIINLGFLHCLYVALGLVAGVGLLISGGTLIKESS
jgi:hypothetical protein